MSSSKIILILTYSPSVVISVDDFISMPVVAQTALGGTVPFSSCIQLSPSNTKISCFEKKVICIIASCQKRFES